jgi:hypothetical protein
MAASLLKTSCHELWETPVSGEIPGAVLLRLLEWCMYLELPSRKLGGVSGRETWSKHTLEVPRITQNNFPNHTRKTVISHGVFDVDDIFKLFDAWHRATMHVIAEDGAILEKVAEGQEHVLREAGHGNDEQRTRLIH